MELKNIEIKLEGEVAVVKMNRPSALNALNKETLEEMETAVDWMDKNTHLKVIVLTGEGKAFVAGADISEMKDLDAAGARDFAHLGQRIFNKLEKLDKVVIAAINGFALGGGCELALACDIRLASEKAKLGQPEVTLGICPGFGGTQRLPKIVGSSKAKELILTGDIITAQEAHEIGLVDRVFESDKLLSSAMEMANKIASRGYHAVKYSKAAINKGITLDVEKGSEIEADLFAQCFFTEDQKEAMGAFLEKRKPNFTNK